jgi:Rieske Fe-S protein
MAGALGFGGLRRYLDYASEPARPTVFDLGPASAFDSGSRTILPSIPALLVRAGTGFVALSLLCTHLGCTVDEDPNGFTCPCHGSRYDSEGRVIRGPAARPLKRLRTEIAADGHLLVYND